MFVDALPAGTRANLAVLAKAGLADPFYTLQGLERLAGMAEDLLLAPADDGTPCSPEEFRQRFAPLVVGKLADHDDNRVRISLDW